MRKLILLGASAAVLLAAPAPALATTTVSPTSADYGQLPLGATASRQFTISMSADETLRQVNIAVSNDKGWKVRGVTCPTGPPAQLGMFEMPAGDQSCQFAADFTAVSGPDGKLGLTKDTMYVHTYDACASGCTCPPHCNFNGQAVASIPLTANVVAATTCKKRRHKRSAESAKTKKCKKKKGAKR